jgi:hypothetical protein
VKIEDCGVFKSLHEGSQFIFLHKPSALFSCVFPLVIEL